MQQSIKDKGVTKKNEKGTDPNQTGLYDLWIVYKCCVRNIKNQNWSMISQNSLTGSENEGIGSFIQRSHM